MKKLVVLLALLACSCAAVKKDTKVESHIPAIEYVKKAGCGVKIFSVKEHTP